MPEVIRCPECEQSLRVPDHLLGKIVRCPSCKATFTASTEESRAPRSQAETEPPRSRRPRDDDQHVEDRPSKREHRSRRSEDDERAKHRRRRIQEEEDDSEGDPDGHDFGEDEDLESRIPSSRTKGKARDWLRVRQGLALILAGVVALVGALALNILIGAVGMAAAGDSHVRGEDSAAAGAASAVLSCTVLLVALAGLVLDVVGSILCLAAPEHESAKSLAKLSLGIKGFGIFLILVGVVVIVAGMGMLKAAHLAGFLRASRAALVLFGFGYLLLGIQLVVFLLFLRALAKTMRRSGLARGILWLNIVYILSFVLQAGGLVLLLVSIADEEARGTARAPGSGGSGIGVFVGLCSCFGLIASLVVVVWYVVMLTQSRAAIADYVSRR